MKKFALMARIVLPLILLILLIISADTARDSCASALALCGGMIIPSLFPFFVLSAFINKLALPGFIGRLIAPVISRLYGISPAGASALPIGFIGGYPAGAAYIADMVKEKLVSEEEAERLLAFCNNSGPAFIVGVIGGAVFGAAELGMKLYAVHIFSSMMAGLFFRKHYSPTPIAPHRLDSTNTAQAVVSSVKQATASIVNVCGFVLCFSVFVALLQSCGVFSLMCRVIRGFGLDAQLAQAMLTGILELGSGAGAMQGLAASRINLAFAAAMLGWGGLSVHFQTLAVLAESEIKGTLHLAGRLLCAVISFITMYLIF